MKNQIKKIILGISIMALLLPIIRVDYYNDNNNKTEKRNYSIVGLLITDIKDGTIGTNYFK